MTVGVVSVLLLFHGLQAPGVAAQPCWQCLPQYATERSLEEQRAPLFVTVCVHAETRVHAQRKPVRSWMCLVTHIFALSKSLGGKESAELQREGGKS